MTGVLRLAAALTLCAQAAFAHDGKVHSSIAETQSHVRGEAAAAPTGVPLPFDLGGAYRLTDQNGQTRTEADPDGNLQLLFFGYANCQEICSAALPQMADIAQALRERGVPLTPVMITVDPERDTVATMGPALAKFGDELVGLTGSDADLAAVYDLFAIESAVVFEDPVLGPVYAHGGFLYLLDARGGFLTVIPPILSTDRAIDIIATYAPAG